MAGLAPEGSEFDANLYDSNFSEIQSEGQDLFTSFDEVYESFNSMGFQIPLRLGINFYGFKKPFAIQKRGIVPFCKGLDVIVQTPSGTGKTMTFCIGILQRLDLCTQWCQALVIVPTIKLADYIRIRIVKGPGFNLDVKAHGCAKARHDQSVLSRCSREPVHVVVGTPGQVYDLLQSRSFRGNHIKMVVLDEADEMLSRGFEDQIYDIFQHLPSEVQVGVFSATMPPEALEFTRKFMKKPLRISVKCDPPRNPSPPDMSAKRRRLSPDSLIEDILRLPDSLIEKIILHLPFSSVLGFFSISKPWLSDTTSQYFLRRWGYQPPPVRPPLASLIQDPVYPPLAFLIQDCYTPARRNFFLCSGVPEVMISGFDLNDFLPTSYPVEFNPYVVMGSCGDLMLCSNQKTWQRKYYVVNPITHHWVAVTPPSQTYENVLVGFICEAASIAEAKKGGELQYSVVRIPVFQHLTTKFKVGIFMSKDQQWKDYDMTLTEDLTTSLCIRIAIACKGSLYWHFDDYGVKVMALDPFNPTEKGIHVIQNGPNRLYLKPKSHVLGFCQGKLRMSEMFWSEDKNCEALSINIWELKDSKAKWQLVHEVQLKEILDANSLIVHPRSAVEGSWWTLGFHPCRTEIIYFYLECNYIKNVICCNWKEKSLKIEIEDDINETFRSHLDAIPFLLPRVPTPLPAFEAVPEDVPPQQQ